MAEEEGALRPLGPEPDRVGQGRDRCGVACGGEIGLAGWDGEEGGEGGGGGTGEREEGSEGRTSDEAPAKVDPVEVVFFCVHVPGIGGVLAGRRKEGKKGGGEGKRETNAIWPMLFEMA